MLPGPFYNRMGCKGKTKDQDGVIKGKTGSMTKLGIN